MGRPHADPETGETTFNIEWLRGKVGNVVSKLQAELAAMWQLLATSPQTTRNKRPASGLVSETPSKVKCATWGADWREIFRDTLQEDVVLRTLALPL